MLELYSLNPVTFEREDLFDEFESLIWTERYIEPGEVKLVLPATRERVKLMRPGRLLELKSSREPMLVDTREIDQGMLIVNGKTLDAYLTERPILDRFQLTGTPGEIMGGIVEHLQDSIFPVPGLTVGLLESEGWSRTRWIQIGTVHESLLKFANEGNVGMSVFLVREGTNRLVFSTRAGENLTRSGNASKLVRFSPDLQNLANAKELLSVANFKTTIVMFPPKLPWLEPWNPNIYEPYYFDSIFDVNLDPFERRFLVIKNDDITEEMLGPGEGYTPDKADELARIMEERQNKAIDEHKKTKIVDGEVPLDSILKYRKDYHLGDKVEIEGHFGSPISGMVTEYIHSSDGTGERHYPSVVAGHGQPIDMPV